MDVIGSLIVTLSTDASDKDVIGVGTLLKYSTDSKVCV